MRSGTNWTPTIDLLYPFSEQELEDEIHQMDQHFIEHLKASGLGEGPIGDPDDEDDQKGALGEPLGLATEEVLALWEAAELSSGQGSNGETVYAWYLHGEPASVALGIGGDVLFVESVTVDPDDPDQVDVRAWPEGMVTLPRTATEDPDIGTSASEPTCRWLRASSPAMVLPSIEVSKWPTRPSQCPSEASSSAASARKAGLGRIPASCPARCLAPRSLGRDGDV